MKKRRKTPVEIKQVEAASCSVDVRLSILHGLPFFKNLEHESIAEINKYFNDIHYNPEQVIYRRGERANRLCVIASGSVKLTKVSVDGNNILVDILKQGEFFGNLDPFGSAAYGETAVAQVSSCILKIDSNNFRSILNKFPKAALDVLDILSTRLRDAQEIIKQLSSSSVENRIAYTLLKLSQKLGEEKEMGILIQIPLSRNDIAGMTGTTPETTSRIISKMQKDGIIETGRKWIAVKNIAKLEKLVELD